MSVAAKERTVGSMVAGKYRLVRVLGRGGMGVVYEAEHSMTRRRVAVKVLHPHHKESSDAAKRFINEAQAAGRIQHPNVVEVLDAGEDSDGSLYLVLELLSGQDLATQLMRMRRLEVAETIMIVAQVLQALVIAHRQGIIHRDIKPENIFLTRSVTGDRHVKILDFGISKAISGDQAFAPSVTQTNTTVGTPHYMSPEQARGERTIDTRADLWAVGVVMFECLAGKVPFDGETYNDQIVRVITEPHEPLLEYDVPEEISRIVDRALEKDKNRRYALAGQMLADIREFISRHPEYSSVPAQYLREPAPVRTPLPPTAPASPTSPTIETSLDPAAFEGLGIGPSDTVPSVPASASLYDSANEDVPTTVKMMNDEPPRAPGTLPPLAGGPRFVGAPVMSGTQPVSPSLPPMRSASPRVDHAARKQRAAMIVGALMIGSVAIGAAIALSARRTPTTVAAPTTAALSSTVSLRFVGAPRGAFVALNGVPANPEAAVVARASTPLDVMVSAPGYGLLHFQLVPDRDQTVPIVLPPAAVPAQIAPAPIAPVPPPVAPRASSNTVVAPRSASPSPAAPAAAPPAQAAHAAPPVARTSSTITVRGAGCTIAVDGQIRGRTPIAHLLVTPGSHRVMCRTATGAIRSRDVSIAPGLESTVSFD